MGSVLRDCFDVSEEIVFAIADCSLGSEGDPLARPMGPLEAAASCGTATGACAGSLVVLAALVSVEIDGNCTAADCVLMLLLFGKFLLFGLCLRFGYV